MGVDCCIRLPYNVRIDDVATVMGRLAGKELIEDSFENNGRKCFYYKAKDVAIKKIDSNSLVSCANIFINTLQGDALEARQYDANAYVMFHFEPSNPTPACGRLLTPRSTMFWIAIGKGLVEFFGGEVDFNDCDNVKVDFKRKVKANKFNCPERDPDWQKFQYRIRDIKPLTKEQYQECSLVAACYWKE